MKKSLYTLIALLFPVLASAQDGEKNFQLGFTASPNLGWARFSNAPSNFSTNGSKVGFAYGLIGDFGFSKNYFFSTAFTITSINARVKETDGTNTTESTIDMQYIEIPLTIKLKTNPNAGKSFYGQFGVSGGINIKGKSDIKIKTATAVQENLKNQKLSDDYIGRLGLVAGAGVQWDYQDNAKFITGLTFNNGFTNIFSKEPSIKNSYLALTLGVMF